MKAHIQTNFKVPHPTLVALGISAAISAVIIGIFYVADSNGIFGMDNAFAERKAKTSKGEIW